MHLISVSPKWIDQVFKMRGIPRMDVVSMGNAIDQMTDEQREDLLVAMRSLERGTENGETLSFVRAALRCKEPAPVQELLPPQPLADSVAPYEIAKANYLKQAVTRPPERSAIPSSTSKNNARRDVSTESFGRSRRKHHIYGKSGALTIELDVLKDLDSSGNQVQTILIEAARAFSSKRYDWESKIPFQLMKRELPLLACALLGMLNQPLLFSNHGPESNKSLALEDQGSKLFVRVSMGSRVVALPVEDADVYQWMDILFEAIGSTTGVDGSMRMSMLRRTASLFNQKFTSLSEHEIAKN